MTVWILFVILLEPDRYFVSPNGFYTTMEQCFEARQLFILSAPQPKMNYEAICIQTDKVEMQ
jgi:hypothetical protein